MKQKRDYYSSDWSARYETCLEEAPGLEYLHEESLAKISDLNLG